MTYNTDRFLAGVEKALGSLKTYQRQGFVEIITEFTKRGLSSSTGALDVRWLAYMLATAWHETACTMRPIAEYGKGRGHPYGLPAGPQKLLYYGRGYVQLTWYANYSKLRALIKKLLGVDHPLDTNPETALDPACAADVMFVGMMQGAFTGKSLSTYFNKIADDPVGARRIINGTDQASRIAGYHRVFLRSLNGATEVSTGTQAPKAPVSPEAPQVVIPVVPAPPIIHPEPSAAAPTLGEVIWGLLKKAFHGRN